MYKNPRLQILLNPSVDNVKTMSEVAFDIPEEVIAPLRSIFSFENMGCREFEGSTLLIALQSFVRKAQTQDMCNVSLYLDDSYERQVNIIAPISIVDDALLFFYDQISDEPQLSLFTHSRMYKSVQDSPVISKAFKIDGDIALPEQKVVGWFDLDNSIWIFIDQDVNARFQAFFNLYGNIPNLDENLNFQPSCGMPEVKALQQMKNLAGVLAENVGCNFNGKYLVSQPS